MTATREELKRLAELAVEELVESGNCPDDMRHCVEVGVSKSSCKTCWLNYLEKKVENEQA